eukprot:gene32534-33298_t
MIALFGTFMIMIIILAVLALIALFTHNHLFWIAGLLLALIDLPDFWSPLRSIARSLEKMSGREPEPEPDAHGHVPAVHTAVGEPALPVAETTVFLLCSMLTILPDYLYRRYVQGRRFGREITLYSVWYELRYGITACVMLTLTLITLVFYFHPSTKNVTSAFRT